MIATKKQIVIIVGFSLVFAGLYAFIFDAKIDLNGDNANYYMLGKALHDGEGFTSVNSINKTPNNHFPPGYPAILSAFFFLSQSFVAVKVLNGALLYFSLVIGYFVIKKIAGIQIAWLSLIFMLLNSHFLKYSTIMMTEIPFLFFSLLSFWFFMKAYEKRGQREYRNYVFAFLFFIVAFYIRTLGIAILAAYGLVLLLDWKSSWKVLSAYVLGFVVCFLPWFLRGQSLGGNSYVKQLTMINPYRPELGEAGIYDFMTRFVNNLGRYISREFTEVLFPYRYVNYKEPVGNIEWVIGVLVTACVVYGIIKLKNHRKLIIGYVLATFAVLLLWPNVWVGVRFVLPMLPFLVMFFVNGCTELLARIPTKKVPSWIVLVFVLPCIFEIDDLNSRAAKPYEPKWDNYFTIAKAIKKQGNADLVVSCRKPTLFYLFSGTYTTRYAYTLDHQELLSDLEDRKVDLVVVEQLGYSSTFRYLYPAVENNPERFDLILKIPEPDTYLLQFKK